MFAVLLVLGTTGLFPKVQVGEPVMEKVESPHPYSGKDAVAFQEVFYYPNAGYIAIHFSKFDLAPGDYVEISTPDGSYSYTYRGQGKQVRQGQAIISEFWATHIPGDTAVLTLHANSRKGGWGFEIDQWARGYEREYIQALMSSLEEEYVGSVEAICSADDKENAICYNGTPIYEKSKAVSRLLIGGYSACTGWLLGSEGHLMTNNHCISTQSDADNTDYEFMAEGSNCGSNCKSWGACPGTIEATSGTLVKTDATLDYTLILLPGNPSTKYGYLQLRNAIPTIGERIYIPQHPSAYGKYIAVNSDMDGGYCEVYSTSEAPCSGGPGDIGYYADTEGGSSGSPVIATSDHLVVALHHCANCPNRGVPIPSIITSLGSKIPNNAIGSGGPVTTAPAAPSNLTASAQKNAVVKLNWTDNANNETGFKVYRGTSSTNLTLITTLAANTTTYTNSGLAKRVTYYYKVCAYNTDGESCSSIVSVKTR